MDYTTAIVIIVIVIVFSIAIAVVGIYLSKKRLEKIIAELGLVQGEEYTVITNNGNRLLNLTFDRIAYGNKSENGNINIYFIRDSKYRGIITKKEVMIKYGNIWQISRTNVATDYNDEYSDTENELN